MEIIFEVVFFWSESFEVCPSQPSSGCPIKLCIAPSPRAILEVLAPGSFALSTSALICSIRVVRIRAVDQTTFLSLTFRTVCWIGGATITAIFNLLSVWSLRNKKAKQLQKHSKILIILNAFVGMSDFKMSLALPALIAATKATKNKAIINLLFILGEVSGDW